jgi:HD superfamily phosphodiesterase
LNERERERERELDYQVKIVSDMEILLITVLLHDLVVYLKRSAKSSDESADLAENSLQSYCYPKKR